MGKGITRPGRDDPSSQDERVLVAAALRDRNAYGSLVARYEPPLSRYVRRLLGRHAQSAEDVLQDVFIKAYVNLNDYDHSRPFAPWIYRIAHNEAIGFLRKRGAQPQLIDGEDGLVILERLADPDAARDAAGRNGLERLVHAALAELGQRYREVLVLRYLEEKSYDDIADILELPPGTVATRIRRGLSRMKAALESLGIDIGALP